MSLFENVVISESIEMNTSPEKVFAFLTEIVDENRYKAWHKKDHIRFRWIKGEPWKEGSIMYSEECLHGKIHKMIYKVTQVESNRKIEYLPTSRMLRKYYPKNEFIIEPTGDCCLFTASVTICITCINSQEYEKSPANDKIFLPIFSF